MASERFRPRLPLDPFAAIDHIPWSIPKNLPLSHPQIILILGEPPIQELIPLLTSTHLSHCLVLIATYTPPVIPASTRGPAVRILRLSQPLAAHDAGALRLVNIFERAQRVALLWPRDSLAHAIQLAQSSPIGDFSIIEPISFVHAPENLTVQYPSPAPSVSESVSSSKRRSFLSPYKKLQRTTPPQKYLDDKVNFDAIINFLPRNLPDKALLKHAILVTTLSAQFFAPPTYIPTPASFHGQTTPHSLSSSSSNAAPTIGSPSGGRSDTSHGSSPPQRRLSQSWRSPSTTTSRAKNRFSLLFRNGPSSSTQQPDSWPLADLSGTNQTTPQGSWKLKNVHLVHVLPRGWNPDSDAEFDGSDRRASSSSRLAGPSRQPHLGGYYKPPGDIYKPKLVQNIEQFLLSFAYPLASLVSSNSGYGLGPGTGRSDAGPSNSNQRPKSVQPSYIKREPVTISRPRPTSTSTLGLIGNAKPYKQEGSLVRSSTLPSTSIYSNNTPSLKPAPYLLAPGIFGRCVGRSNTRSARCSIPSSESVVEEELDRDEQEDTRGDATTALTIGEIILLGALDFDHTRPGSGRAWIGSVNDVVIEVGASPDPGSGSSKGKNKAGTVNMEKMKTTDGMTNFGLPSPPDSSSSSTEGGEEQTSNFGHSRHIPPALSSPTQLDDIGSLGEKREELVVSPTLTTLTATKPKAGTSNITSSSPSTSTPTSNSYSSPLASTSTPKPAFTIVNSNNTSDKVKDSNGISDSVPQLPLLVVHRDRARTRGSGDSYDLGLGHGVPVPPMTVSMKPGSRSVSGSSGMIPLETQEREAYKGTGSLGRKGSERNGFMGALGKMGLWRSGGGGKSRGVLGLKA